jgi:hypothetical protein
MVFKLAFGIFTLIDSLVEGNINLTAFFTHVIGSLLKNAVDHGPQVDRTLAFTLSFLNVFMGEILPVFGCHRAEKI